MKLNDADNIYIGSQQVDKVYIGDAEVWTAAEEQRYFRTNSGTTDYIQLDSAVAPAEIEMDVYPISGESNLPGAPTVTLQKLQTIRYTYSGAVITQLFNGFSGIVANLKFYNASGVVINSWRIDENAGVLVDSVGGNSGTVINGAVGDWEFMVFEASKGYWIGDSVLKNGDFSLGSTNWIVQSEWAITGGAATYDGNGISGSRDLQQDGVYSAGYEYLISTEITSYTRGSLGIYTGGVNQLPQSTGVHTLSLIVSRTAFIIHGLSGVSTVATVDNITVKRILRVLQ